MNKETYICPICGKEEKKKSFFGEMRYSTKDDKLVCGSCGKNINARTLKLFNEIDENIYTQSSINNIKKTFDFLWNPPISDAYKHHTSFSLAQIMKLCKADADEVLEIINDASVGHKLYLHRKNEVYELSSNAEWFIDYHTKRVVMNGEFKYSDILSYEYVEDGDLVKKGNSGLEGALLGAAILGRTGATVGAIITRDKRVCSEITKAELIIYIKRDKDIIQRSLTIINEPIEKGSKKYLDKYNTAVEIMRHLDAIMKRAEQEAEKAKNEKIEQLAQSFNEISEVKNAPKQTTVVQNDDVVVQLRKFKELLDDGVITEDEFSAKKKQLLNIE